jgi:hypothetical protein
LRSRGKKNPPAGEAVTAAAFKADSARFGDHLPALSVFLHRGERLATEGATRAFGQLGGGWIVFEVAFE